MIISFDELLNKSGMHIKSNYVVEFDGQEYIPENLFDSFFGENSTFLKSILKDTEVKRKRKNNEYYYSLYELYYTIDKLICAFEERLDTFQNTKAKIKLIYNPAECDDTYPDYYD